MKVPRREWLTGKPLAAAGLQLFPRKPKWTALQSVTGGGGKNLLVRLEFGSAGKPLHAAIVRGSGNKRIDDVILASLYKWRAKGKPLAELEKGMRIPVQLELVLTVK